MFVRKKEGETTSGLLYRFSKRVQQSGILKEAKKRRFHSRPVNHMKRRLSAIHRDVQKKEREHLKKMGLV
ncbi:MAG TPA: 30S ribosomal protein S21 [Candidatus Paceibacterota bacterium]